MTQQQGVTAMRGTMTPTLDVIGYRKDGRPIHLIRGGAEDGGQGGGDGGQAGGAGSSGGDGGQQTGQQTPAGDPAKPWEAETDPTKLREIAARYAREAAEAGGKSRDQARAQAADEAIKTLKAEIAKSLGLTPEEVDPAKLQATNEQLAQAQEASARELAVYRLCTSGGDLDGVKAGALLDRRSFLATIATLKPDDTAGLTKAITDAVTSDATLRSRQVAGGGSPGHSGGTGDQQPSAATAAPGQARIAAAFAESSR